MRKFLIQYRCEFCGQHRFQNIRPPYHETTYEAGDIIEATLLSAADPYIDKDKIIGIREIRLGLADRKWSDA